MTEPTLDLERSLAGPGVNRIAGVDEVGRGSWAGPIVAAAVILPLEDPDLAFRLSGLRDSKQLTAAQREELLARIRRVASGIGVGWCTRWHIDVLGINAANRAAMERAVMGLTPPPAALVVDHVRLESFDLPQVAVPRADSLSLSVAAASVVAKVIRDRLMQRCDGRYPGYGFARHKGYGTRAHHEALQRLGPCPLHRRSFAPVAVLAG